MTHSNDESDPEGAAKTGSLPLLKDVSLAILILMVLPMTLGLLGYDLLVFAVYSLLAGMLLSTIAWRRERKQGRTSIDDLAAATVLRVLLVFLLGGVFMILGALLS